MHYCAMCAYAGYFQTWRYQLVSSCILISQSHISKVCTRTSDRVRDTRTHRSEPEVYLGPIKRWVVTTKWKYVAICYWKTVSTKCLPGGESKYRIPEVFTKYGSPPARERYRTRTRQRIFPKEISYFSTAVNLCRARLPIILDKWKCPNQDLLTAEHLFLNTHFQCELFI